jgi:hypothetical protein
MGLLWHIGPGTASTEFNGAPDSATPWNGVLVSQRVGAAPQGKMFCHGGPSVNISLTK